LSVPKGASAGRLIKGERVCEMNRGGGKRIISKRTDYRS